MNIIPAIDRFINKRMYVNSRTLNVLSAGIMVIGDELFSETELINFISILYQTPMLGGLQETGMKILEWLTELYRTGINTLDFDRSLYYHSRQRNKDTMPYSYDEMLKAPNGIPNAGRFNQVGRAHYYFADTRNGAEAEVKKTFERRPRDSDNKNKTCKEY